MGTWHEETDPCVGSDVFDPLCIERSAPMTDQEAALAEELCLAATPGPIVIDEDSAEDASPVATLPDGRTLVSMSVPIGHHQGDGTLEANAQLFCKARYLLLRLLRDRQQWKEQQEFLLTRIRTLEIAVRNESEAAAASQASVETVVMNRPR